MSKNKTTKPRAIQPLTPEKALNAYNNPMLPTKEKDN